MKSTLILNFYFLLLPIIFFPSSFEVALDLIWKTELVPLELDPILLAWKAGPKVDWPQRKIEAREKEKKKGKIEKEKSRPFKNTHC